MRHGNPRNCERYHLDVETVARLLGMTKAAVWMSERRAIRRLWRNWRRYAGL